jgi:hypothetical protein
MYLGGIIPIAINVTFEHPFQRARSKIRPAESRGVKKYLLQVAREFIAVPNAKVGELVPTEEQSFQV